MTVPGDPADPAGPLSVSVPVQWALHGKRPDGDGYRILACSNGDLNRANFADALGRFSMGVLDTLPQVSVSYLQPATRSPGGGYLALAIDWFATDGQRYAGGVTPADGVGRRTAFTSYFCAPYRDLAAKAVTYQEMHEAFGAVALPGADGPARTLTFKASPRRLPAVDELAMLVGPLLLTGTPVCVLGAEETSLADRLRFIDAVMSLLPYGFRARMTAATWTRATYQSHRFRLYFSTAPRTDQKDHVVRWGAPDEAHLPRGQAKDYFDWLADKVSPLTRLADLSEFNTDLRFDNKALTSALELADSLQGRRRSGPFGESRLWRSRPAGGEAASPRSAPAAADEIEKVLRDCVDYVDGQNIVRLRSACAWLARQAKADSALQQQIEADPARQALAEAVDARRRRYRQRIREYGLLQPNPALGYREKALYAALLDVAFGRPLSYAGYCQVEKCLDGEPGEHPHPALLQAIKEGEIALETKALVLYLTRQERNEKELNRWYGSGELDPVALIHWLARDWSRPHHARVICDLTLDFLHKMPTRYDQASVRAALRQHGFLAHALQVRHPDKEQYQIAALHRFLLTAYPGGVGRQAIGRILAGTSHPPTPALLAAVLMNVSTAGESQFALEAYVHGSLTLMNIHPGTYAHLQARVPSLDQPPDAGRAPEAAARSAPRDDPTETILRQCASQALAKNLAALRDSVTALRVYAAHAANRGRYRQLVVEHQLLSADLGLGALTGEFYDVVLKLAFGTPLGYQGFCQLVDCLPAAGQAEPRPHDALLLAIDRAAGADLKGSPPDLRVTAIAAAYLDSSAQRNGKSRLRQADAARMIDAKFSSGQLNAVRLIEALTETWERPHHAELVLDVLTGYLIAARGRAGGVDRPALLRSLVEHGHLAPALRSRYPESEPAQISALAQLLDAVYPDQLDEPTAWTILSPEAQTDALFTVVSGKTDDPKVKARITRLIRDSVRPQ